MRYLYTLALQVFLVCACASQSTQSVRERLSEVINRLAEPSCNTFAAYKQAIGENIKPLRLLNDDELIEVVSIIKCNHCSDEDKAKSRIRLIGACFSSYAGAKRRLETILNSRADSLPADVASAFREYIGSELIIRVDGITRIGNFRDADPSSEDAVNRIWTWSRVRSNDNLLFVGPYLKDPREMVFSIDRRPIAFSGDSMTVDHGRPIISSSGSLNAYGSLMEFYAQQAALQTGRNIVYTYLGHGTPLVTAKQGNLFVINTLIEPGSLNVFGGIDQNRGGRLMCIDYETDRNNPKLIAYEHPSLISDLLVISKDYPLFQSIIKKSSGVFTEASVEVKPAPIPLCMGANDCTVAIKQSQIATIWILKRLLSGKPIPASFEGEIDWQHQLRIMVAEYFTGRMRPDDDGSSDLTALPVSGAANPLSEIYIQPPEVEPPTHTHPHLETLTRTQNQTQTQASSDPTAKSQPQASSDSTAKSQTHPPSDPTAKFQPHPPSDSTAKSQTQASSGYSTATWILISGGVVICISVLVIVTLVFIKKKSTSF